MLRASLDSAMAVGSLLVAVVAYGVPFDGAHLILALLVFSLTFPGNTPSGTSLRGHAGDVAASWTVVVALLLLLGWTTQTLVFFDLRVLLTWVLATPAAQLAAHVVLPALLPRLLAAEGMQRVAVVAVCETPFWGINGVIKRASDLVLASAILLLIAPLMLAIAIGVKLSSPGPALFKQRRYGVDGREIVVYKFRTMTVLEDGVAIRQATRDDPRVTPFGAILRRYSLDELPQFINVLQGRMSVVGPRPHAVAHNELYRKLIKSYMIRHKVKPGITGWAQVNGYRGETGDIDKMRARIEHDLDYLRNWSLRLDLKIILKTLFVVLKPQNAY